MTDDFVLPEFDLEELPEGDQGWSAANKYASLIEPIPSSVSDAVRILWQQHNVNGLTGTEAITYECKAVVDRLNRSKVLTTPLYFACAELFPDRVDDLREDNIAQAMLSILKPGLFSSLLAYTYVIKRVNKIRETEEWDKLSKEIVFNMELGYVLGGSIPSLTAADGVFIGGVRLLALATIMIHNEESYTRYRNLNRGKFNREDERSRWGCELSQIAARITQVLGFRNDVLDVAIPFRKDEEDREIERMDEELKAWRAALFWIDDLKEGVFPPKYEGARADLKFDEDSVATLKSKTDAVLEQGSTFQWMFRKSQK